MLRPLELDPETEAAVRFVEDTDPAEIVAKAVERLRAGEATEMHAHKMQQAGFEECHTTREPYRGVHMVAAARHLATVYGSLPREISPPAARLLDL